LARGILRRQGNEMRNRLFEAFNEGLERLDFNFFCVKILGDHCGSFKRLKFFYFFMQKEVTNKEREIKMQEKETMITQ
jgi:hypothetical protein